MKTNFLIRIALCFLMFFSIRTDAVVVISSDQSDYTFLSGTTYFIAGQINCDGTTTIQGGAVLKYAPDASLSVVAVIGPTNASQPAIFTAGDDDSVGQSLSGVWGSYTGVIQSGGYANAALQFDDPLSDFTVNNVIFKYAQMAINYDGYSNPFGSLGSELSTWVNLTNAQIIGCVQGIANEQASLNNCLVSSNGVLLSGPGACYDTLNLNQCTIDQSTLDSCFQDVGSILELYATNSIFSGPDWSDSNEGFDVFASYNGFYNTPETRGDNTQSTGSYPFTASGLDNYYLAGDYPFRNTGTVNIDPGLLADIETMTTYAPQNGSYPDNDGEPDLGYHYPVPVSGTDFWLMFYDTIFDTIGEGPYPKLSLFISSPTGARGTATILTNGPVLTLSGCGDASVNGTYVRGSLPEYMLDILGSSAPAWVYLKDTNFIFATFDYNNNLEWWLESYNPDSDPYYSPFVPLYWAAVSSGLNGANWSQYEDMSDPPTSTVCVQYPLNITFTVTAGGATNLFLPSPTNSYPLDTGLPTGAMMWDFDRVEAYGVHVTANAPVSVYGMNYLSAASGAFTAYPTTSLGTNYCVMARPSYLNDGTYFYSQFAIVGTESNTTVTIDPSSTANLTGSLWNDPIVLQPGQTYQAHSVYDNNDVTGTWISSDKPVAVFAGANLANVPDANAAAGNPLVQEQFPVQNWGTNVLAMSFAARTNGDNYRILAASNSTTVTITGDVVTIVDESVQPWTVTAANGTVTTNLSAGQFCDITVDGPVQFLSTKPIQVAQFGNGNGFDAATSARNSQEGDPCEILLPPAGDYPAVNVVYTPTNATAFDKNFLNLIVPQSATNSISVDSSLVPVTAYMPISTSGYFGAQIPITNGGPHTVTSSQPVGVEVYGWGEWDAYSYMGGTSK